MGTGTSLAKDRIRSSQSPVHVHSGTPSTGASQIQVTTEDGRGLLRLGSADIPSGSVTGILVREILVRGTKIFSGKLVRPDRFFREKWSASGKLVRIMVRP